MKKKQADEHEKFSQLLSKKKYISFENFYRIRTRAVMSQSYILYLLCSNTFYKIIPRCSKGSQTHSKLIQKLVYFQTKNYGLGTSNRELNLERRFRFSFFKLRSMGKPL